ncbi:macrophage mannose receptor 1b [Aplochiton taeniatus]
MLSTRKTATIIMVIIQTSQCWAAQDTPFILMNKPTQFCFHLNGIGCFELRWTSSQRIFSTLNRKCMGVQGKTVGSEVNWYDCDETSELQQWECRNQTLLALKGQALFIETINQRARLSRDTGPNSHFTLDGGPEGACTRTYRELFTINGNSFGRPCMFPFFYKDKWYGDCTAAGSSIKRPWCAIDTKFADRELWGYCPSTSTEHWQPNPVTKTFYLFNFQAALTWHQAHASCRQQGAHLLSITEPHDQTQTLTAMMWKTQSKLWMGLNILDQERGWQWTDGRPYRYLRWDSGHPLLDPGQDCVVIDPMEQFNWQTSVCTLMRGYICHKGMPAPQLDPVPTGSCASPWIPYNGHCYQLQRAQKTWSDALTECSKDRGSLASIHNIEEQSFAITQLGYTAADELWIGLNDKRTKLFFEWSDHTTVTYVNWEFRKPNSNPANCVLISGQEGRWVDSLCEEKHGYVCMKKSTSQSSEEEVELHAGCNPGWRRHGSYCYLVGTQTKTFEEAKERCYPSNSYMVDVANGVDNAFLVSLVGMRPEKYFWLGLSNQKMVNNFVWTNSKSTTFTHWNAGMPGSRQGCVAMTTGTLAGLWDVLPCTNQEKYICKHLAEGVVPTLAPTTSTPPSCHPGWRPSGRGDVCFKFFSQPLKTWFEARDYCRAIGEDLLSIHSATELTIIRSNRGTWNDRQCEAYNKWICQIQAGVTPNLPPNDTVTVQYVTKDGWLVWGGSQYFLNNNQMVMEDARHFCQKKHGDLVIINSAAENDFLWKKISRGGYQYYIGLMVDLDGSNEWIDGTDVVFERWNENQPSLTNFDKTCVGMTHSMGSWYTINCGKELPSICKRSATAPINSTASPALARKGGCQPDWYSVDSKCVAMSRSPSQFGKWFVYSCNDTLGYVCQKNVNEHIEVAPTSAIPVGYIKFGNDSFKVVAKNLTWQDAERNCVEEGAHLASIRDIWSEAYIETLTLRLKMPVWIGLNKMETDGYFRFIDGWHLSVTQWGLGEPRSKQPCVYLEETGVWRTAYCNRTLYSVCKISDDVPPTVPAQFPGECPEPLPFPRSDQSIAWMPFKGNCYVFIVQKESWTQAATSCALHGAVLASIEDSTEQTFIRNNLQMLKDDHFAVWIGLFKTHKGQWLWLDKTVMDFTNWDVDQPPESFGGIRSSDGTWAAFSNWIGRAYICKTPKVLKLNLAVTTASPNSKRGERFHSGLAAVAIVTTILTIGGLAAFFRYAKTGHSRATFANPLYFHSQPSQLDLVDCDGPMENVEVEDSEPNTPLV